MYPSRVNTVPISWYVTHAGPQKMGVVGGVRLKGRGISLPANTLNFESYRLSWQQHYCPIGLTECLPKQDFPHRNLFRSLISTHPFSRPSLKIGPKETKSTVRSTVSGQPRNKWKRKHRKLVVHWTRRFSSIHQTRFVGRSGPELLSRTWQPRLQSKIPFCYAREVGHSWKQKGQET